MACGQKHTVVITRKGLYAWGLNSCGHLGKRTGRTQLIKNPIFINLPSRPLQVACGKEHTAVITERGLYTWGYNRYGQLGDGTTTRYIASTPKFIKLDKNPLQVACGDFFTVVITKEGFYSWGYGNDGQLGNGTQISSRVPVFTRLSNPLYVACGKDHTAVITEKGLYTWGCGNDGQLGNGSFQSSSVPIRVNLRRPLQVACGRSHTIAMTEKCIYGWGSNLFGESGTHGYLPSQIPRKFKH